MLDPYSTPEHYADAYVHLLLTQEQAAAFEQRCEQDENFRRALDKARQRKELLESSPSSEASEQLVGDTLDRLNETLQRRAKNRDWFKRGVFGLTTAAVVLIGALHIYFANLQPTPYDVRVLGQDELLSGTDAAVRVAVFNRTTGEQLGGVPITLSLVDQSTGDRVKLASYSTGDASSGSVKLPDWDQGQYELSVVARPDGFEESLTRSVKLVRRWKLMLSSDKPIYQPGQTIHLRSLALRKPDLKPVADQQVVFTVADPKGNVIFKHQTTASRFGIAAVDCPLATEITTGPYRVACRIGETVSEKTVTVEKYVLPKFKLNVTLDRPFYQPGEPVQGTVQADYFFGKPVTEGQVAIEVHTDDVEATTITSLVETTDQAGKANFAFTLPEKLFGSEHNSGDAQFSLVATVTDSAGQTYSRGLQRIVTPRPIHLEVVPELGRLVQGVKNKLFVFASYADGRPAEVDITFNGTDNRAKTNRLGVAEIMVTPESPALGITLVAKDRQDRVARKHVELNCGKVASDFVLRTDKATYSGGETITLTALGGGVEPVMVDFLKDGQTVLTTTFEMANGQGQYQIDLPPDMFGTISLVAYRFGLTGLPVRKTKLIFVHQARGLQVAASFNQETYRPGTAAKLKLKLTDQAGQPTAGAISLAAVDEAVFAVLGQRPGMEQVFFQLGEELLEPVYAIYNWDPFERGKVPPEDVDRWEQALFSRAAEQGQNSNTQLLKLVEKYTDGDPYLLEVLEHPDLEELLESAWVPEELKELIHEGSPHTLNANSFPAKKNEISQRRRSGLTTIYITWGCLSVFVVGSGLVWLMMNVNHFSQFMVVVVVSLMLAALLMPAVQSAREAARRNSAVNSLRQLGFAVELDSAASASDAGEESVPVEGEGDSPAGGEAAGSPAPRVRRWFPETLLWRPQVITDDAGEATLEIPLADSITSWRLTASAVSAVGQLGGAEFPIRVFQPFFVDLDLPVALTRSDQVGVPVVVYNYLDEPQEVTLTLEDADWFTRLDAEGKPLEANEPLTLKLGPSEIRSIHLPLRVEQVGQQSLQVTAIGSGMSDAIKRRIEVVPNGRRVEQIVSGTLDSPAEVSLSLPAEHIEGSARAIVKLYPSKFSQLVEGLDGIFLMRSGCFEQTSSTTYPNVLALSYLRRTKMNAPEVEAKARQYIHVGYQRLVSFEVSGGGFDWFGNPPANRTLTAYGLMEFEDMARVHDVDPELIERTRDWLLAQRQNDGRWKSESHTLHGGLFSGAGGREQADLAATAYIAWAVFGTGQATGQAPRTLDYLLAHKPDSVSSPYLLAVIANCIAGIDPNHPGLDEYLALLERMKKSSPDGKQVFWTQAQGEQTMFYGSGRSGDIETTAMATLALMKSGQHSGIVKKSLAWLVAQKDGNGTWYSTQATVLALKALVQATGTSLGGEKERKIEIALGGRVVRTIDIPADQDEVMQQIDLSDLLNPGEQPLTVTDRTDTGTGFQVALWYHLENEATIEPPAEPLSINIAYDRKQLKVNDTVTATATVINNMHSTAPMVIVDLPIPGGFKIDPGELDELVGSKKIAKYQLNARKAIVYLRGLQPSQQLKLVYRLKATMPVKVAVPPGVVYEYYTPENRSLSRAVTLEASTGS